MVKNEFDLISDVIKDAGGPEHLDVFFVLFLFNRLESSSWYAIPC
jgi:hypothetical protein